VPTPSPTPVPTAVPTPTTTPAPTPGTDAFIGPEVAGLPTSGAAWTALKAEADGSAGTPDLCNQDNRDHPGTTLAAALVYARTGDAAYKTKAISLIEAAYPTTRVGCGNAILSLGRQLSAYILAADYVGYRGAGFVSFVDTVRTRELGGHGTWSELKFTANDSSNNWGTFAQASLVVADIYLDDTAAIAQDWARFRGFLGDRSAYVFRKPNGIDPTWFCGSQATAWTPVAVCPGNPRDGAINEDVERDGAYPNVHLTYTQEGMQGLALVAEVLSRQGYDAWPLLDPVADFATRNGVWNASAVGRHLPHMFNERIATGAPTLAAGWGRGFGYTDWLFGS
jgi:hypothetical protein